MENMFKNRKNSPLKLALGNLAPKALDVVGNLTGVKAFNRLSDIISTDTSLSTEEKIQLYELMNAELLITTQDVQSARGREVSLGGADPMMYATGITGLLSFACIVGAILFIPASQENKLFIHLMGIVEGVAMTIFAYYFGTSKSSASKDKVIDKLL